MAIFLQYLHDVLCVCACAFLLYVMLIYRVQQINAPENEGIHQLDKTLFNVHNLIDSHYILFAPPSQKGKN